MNRWRFILDHQLFSGLLGAILVTIVTVAGLIIQMRGGNDTDSARGAATTPTPADEPTLRDGTTPARTPQPTPSPAQPTAEVAGSFGPVAASIDLPGEKDEWTFDGTAGQFLQARADPDPSGNLQPRISVTNKFGEGVCTKGGEEYAQVECWLENTGVHTISVDDRYGRGLGPYTLRYSIDPFIPIMPGVAASGTLPGPGSRDWYTFEAEAGQTVEIRVDRDRTGFVRPRVQLYNFHKDSLGSRTGADYAQLEVTLNDTGTFRVAVDDRYGDGTGKYTIALLVR